jgi:hypothetical protein
MPVRICVAAPEAIEVTIAKLIDVESRPLDEIVPEITEDEGDARILDLRLDTPAVVFADRGDADDRRDRAARGRDHTRNRGNRSLAGYGDNPRGRRAAGRRGLTTLDEVRRVAGETLD